MNKNSTNIASIKNNHLRKRVAYVFQGGGALGAYQIGVVEKLHEAGYVADVVSGISIGAINAAIIAGNSRDKRMEKLHEFWDRISPRLFFHEYDNYENCHEMYNQIGAASATYLGQPGFFKPRMLSPLFSVSTPDKLSFYETDELRNTLSELIDFERLNSQDVRIYLGAVNVATGHLTFFNNHDHTIGPEHIMASAAFPPAFPAVKIDNDYYWDGGVYSNTPIAAVLDIEPARDMLCFAVNCFNQAGSLPKTMNDVYRRIKQIHFSTHLKEYLHLYSKHRNSLSALSYLGKHLPKEIKDHKNIQAILASNSTNRVHIVHIAYSSTDKDTAFIDYNFYRNAIESHKQVGHKDAEAVLKEKAWEQKQENYVGAVIYEAPNNPK